MLQLIGFKYELKGIRKIIKSGQLRSASNGSSFSSFTQWEKPSCVGMKGH
ncbi:MAG TPA: hypothetical protein VF884_04235 [Nitrososphaeraceae archaeon]